MELNNYRVESDGIWIPKKELEKQQRYFDRKTELATTDEERITAITSALVCYELILLIEKEEKNGS